MQLWVSIYIYILYPTNNNYVRIYMRYLPRIMKTNIQQHNGIQYTKMDCRRFGLSTFWSVDVSVCRRFGLSTFWSVCRRFGLSTFRFVDVLVCRHFGLSTFWFVDVSVCRRFGLSTFRSVDVLVCRRFGVSTFRLSTFRFVDVLTSYRTYTIYAHWSMQEYHHHECSKRIPAITLHANFE